MGCFRGPSRQEKLPKEVIDLTKEVKELKATVFSEGGSSSRGGPPSSASSSHDQAAVNDCKRWIGAFSRSVTSKQKTAHYEN
eukprot:8816036-Pyramimonas_sp.AAC.1